MFGELKCGVSGVLYFLMLVKDAESADEIVKPGLAGCTLVCLQNDPA